MILFCPRAKIRLKRKCADCRSLWLAICKQLCVTSHRAQPVGFVGYATRHSTHQEFMLEEVDSLKDELKYVRHLLELKNAELQNKDREHEVEIKKMKDLLHKEQNSISELKVEGVLAVKQMQDQSWKESQLHDKLLSLQKQNRQLEVRNETVAKTLKLEHDEEITKLHNYYDRQEQEIEGQNKKMMQRLREQLDLRREADIQEINEQHKSQMNALMKNHVTAFHDIKNHYNDIIMKLNKQIGDMNLKQKSL